MRSGVRLRGRVRTFTQGADGSKNLAANFFNLKIWLGLYHFWQIIVQGSRFFAVNFINLLNSIGKGSTDLTGFAHAHAGPFSGVRGTILPFNLPRDNRISMPCHLLVYLRYDRSFNNRIMVCARRHVFIPYTLPMLGAYCSLPF
jgi:hypothetical protein